MVVRYHPVSPAFRKLKEDVSQLGIHSKTSQRDKQQEKEITHTQGNGTGDVA